jgi:hypothetical protein
MRASGRRWLAVGALALAGFVAAGCGGGERQDANEPSGTFPVDVVKATFPTKQRLAEKSELQIAIRNAGDKAVPNVAVTVESDEAEQTAAAAAFAEASDQPGLADPSRPVWVLDTAPHGGITAYTNTWALGQLAPNQTKTFVWRVTAVKGGVHAIKYKVAAGLNGKAKAVLAGGNEEPTGTFTVNVSNKPADARVGPDGQVIVVANGKVIVVEPAK